MIQQLEIRKASAIDIPLVLELYAQSDFDNGDILSIEKANEVFNSFQLYPNYSLYIAILEQKVVGTFELLIMDNLGHKGKRTGIVEDVVVDNSYRSIGIGRQMMEYAINICRKYDCYKLALSSNLNRGQAHKFYEELGFKKHGYSFLVEL